MGGYSSEYKISLKSGKVVHAHLNKDKFDSYRVHILKDKWVYVDGKEKEHAINKHDFSVMVDGRTIEFDCVFNAIHGTPGEDGLLQAYFELLGIPHTSRGYYQAAPDIQQARFTQCPETIRNQIGPILLFKSWG